MFERSRKLGHTALVILLNLMKDDANALRSLELYRELRRDRDVLKAISIACLPSFAEGVAMLGSAAARPGSVHQLGLNLGGGQNQNFADSTATSSMATPQAAAAKPNPKPPSN